MFLTPLSNHSNKVDIAWISLQNVTLLFFGSFLLSLQHSLSTLFSLCFHLLDLKARLILGRDDRLQEKSR
jgi:hypothetical protein